MIKFRFCYVSTKEYAVFKVIRSLDECHSLQAQPQPNDRRGRGHSIDDIILKRSRSLIDLEEGVGGAGPVPVASTDGANQDEAAQQDDQHMSDASDPSNANTDSSMTHRPEMPLCSPLHDHSLESADHHLSDYDDFSESHSSECDEDDDEALYGDDELPSMSESSSSSSLSSSSNDHLRRFRLRQQQQQRLRGKSMGPSLFQVYTVRSVALMFV